MRLINIGKRFISYFKYNWLPIILIILSIYDLRGRLVAELANGFHEYSEKSYEINWNANNFASGIYLITLSSDEKVKTQKITLIK